MVAVLAALWVLLGLGVLPEPVQMIVQPIVGLACSLAIPAILITSYAAPGLIRNVVDDVNHFWRRLRTRRRDVDELEVKIAHLDRPYHMNQLGQIYLTQGRVAKAKPWFERALAKEPEGIAAQYNLATCHYAQKQYAAAAELLEQVHAQKPDYDYGMAYLRLAQSQQFVGNHPRAAEIYQTLLRFYPGHPEGLYHYGLLTADGNSPAAARKLMQEAIFAVSHSPGFHRRRNRHWALKAQWWLWRHRSA